MPSSVSRANQASRTRAAGLALSALALAALTACGSSGADNAVVSATSPSATATSPAAGSSGSPTSTTSSTDVQKVNIALVGTTVTPEPGRIKVKQGTTVQLTVTRDSDGEVHIHGYDLEEQAKAGVPVTFTFVADQPGVFEVEAHDPDRQLTQLEVR